MKSHRYRPDCNCHRKALVIGVLATLCVGAGLIVGLVAGVVKLWPSAWNWAQKELGYLAQSENWQFNWVRTSGGTRRRRSHRVASRWPGCVQWSNCKSGPELLLTIMFVFYFANRGCGIALPSHGRTEPETRTSGPCGSEFLVHLRLQSLPRHRIKGSCSANITLVVRSHAEMIIRLPSGEMPRVSLTMSASNPPSLERLELVSRPGS
jgi:hypothetical protein